MSDDNTPVTFDEYGGGQDPSEVVSQEEIPPDDEKTDE